MLEAVLQLPIGFIVALSGALIPGPLLAFVIAKTPASGPKTGTLAAGGHIMVEFGLLALIALGLGTILKNQFFQSIIHVVGGISLIALASISFVEFRATHLAPKSVTKYPPLLGGALFSTVFNPTVILWWATIGTAMLMEAWLVASLAGAAFWILGHFLADLGWFSLVSYSITRGKTLLGTSGHKALVVMCGLILLIFGVYFFARFLLALFQ
ncbi:MAG: LysE family transporter [Candidatus Hodarchaeaceae archaeon]|nr:LysE family transporter [Candidatus Hodarchaeaceae archaeon]